MWTRCAALVTVAGAVLWTFRPALGFAFLNWDDQAVILQNPSLDFPGVVGWAFTTVYMEHYQPLGWLAWAAIKGGFGLDAAAFHAANVVVHLVCVLLVWRVAQAVLKRAMPRLSAGWVSAAALAAALLYGVHPLRVEVVAWVSALPYAIALALMLAALAAYLRAGDRGVPRWPAAALMLYGASLAARPVGLGLPAVLVVLDVWLRKRSVRASAVSAWPFAALAIVAAVIEKAARGAGLNDAPWLYRLQSAAAAPFVYLWHTAAPVALTPLDLLPLDQVASAGVVAASIGALMGAGVVVWVWRHRCPALAAAWASYLALLAPAAGLVPSGLQATADRYAYVPGVVVAIVVAGAGARWAAGRRGGPAIFALGVLIAAVASGASARRVLAHWADSVTLWSRVVALDPASDVGLYNLGAALAAEGRADEAAARYREVLAHQPAHAEARANLDRLDAIRLEREGNALAGRGDLAAAADRYGQAVALDPNRTHSHAGRGMALASVGRTAEALPALREAVRRGVTDPAVANLLGVLLIDGGQTSEARGLFERALAVHPSDVDTAHNLARLLATAPGVTAADAATALRLAGKVVEATGGRDPRAIETLASALAAAGRLAEAHAANARAAALAASQGDADLAVQITARGRAYRNPGQ